MRRKTYLKIVNALRAGVNSKRGIQDHSGLSWGSCSPVINHLLSQKVIVTQDIDQKGTPSKGRKTQFFHFNKEMFLLMGMEIDTKRIISCITTLGNEQLGSYTTEFNQPISAGNIIKYIAKAFLECREKLRLEPKNVCCISFSIPGAVDVERNIWLYCERVPGISEFDFSTVSGKGVLPKNIYIQHNIHAQVHSVIPPVEIKENDYVFIHVGQGMAMSANMGGILYGHRGFAGEIGHIPYPNIKNDVTCLCGKMNCLEAVLNVNGILEYIRDNCAYDVKSLNEIEEEEIIHKVAHEYILDPLVYISTIVSNIFDPKRLIIEGSVLEPFYKCLIEAFEKKLRQTTWLNGPAEVCWYKSSDMDGSYGAVLHSSERIIEDFINQIDMDH
jgi:predicted NBD/HSP70 family sugar kinase